MNRLLAGAGGTITIDNYDADGELADVSGSDVPTVVVRDSAGEIAAGVFTPTKVPSTSGRYECTVPADLTILDTYDVAWTWATPDPDQVRSTQFEIVGSFLFAVAELRASQADFANATAYPAAAIASVRGVVEEDFARIARVSFTRLGRRVSIDGSGDQSIMLPNRKVAGVVSLAIDDVALTSLQLAELAIADSGELSWPGGVFARGHRNVDAFYTHGYLVAPARVRTAAMMYARDLLTTSPLPSRATAEVSELGTFRLSTAGRDGWTGIPDVDSVLRRFGYVFVGG